LDSIKSGFTQIIYPRSYSKTSQQQQAHLQPSIKLQKIRIFQSLNTLDSTKSTVERTKSHLPKEVVDVFFNSNYLVLEGMILELSFVLMVFWFTDPFSLKQPHSCFIKNNGIRISIEPRAASNKGWDFDIRVISMIGIVGIVALLTLGAT